MLVVAILLYKLLASSAFAAHASGHTVRASGRSEKPPRSGIFSPHPLRDDAAIPSEFRISRPHTGELQAQLFHEFGLLAIDKTDEHSAIVLRNLLFLLRNGPPPGATRRLDNLRYIYAYAGHDGRYDLAAYHVEAKAISIGGRSIYPDDAPNRSEPDAQLLSTLAHEIGHAFLFRHLSPYSLRRLGSAYGGWGPVFTLPADSLYSPAFLSPHPGIAAGASLKALSLSSGLAAKNIHEWFADAFASAILVKLGARGALGENWRDLLVKKPAHRGEYWANYNNVSRKFSAWLENKMSEHESHIGKKERPENARSSGLLSNRYYPIQINSFSGVQMD